MILVVTGGASVTVDADFFVRLADGSLDTYATDPDLDPGAAVVVQHFASWDGLTADRADAEREPF